MVQYFAHITAARVCEKAASTERARAQLHSALEPADNGTVRDHARQSWKENIIGQRLVFQPGIIEGRATFIVCKPWPPISMAHDKAAGLIEQLVPNVVRGPDRASSIPRRGLDKEILERRL